MASSRSHPAPNNEMAPTFTNPILWEDLPDMDVICVDNTYYMSVSSFHFSPGAPLLQSCNLVDWEYIGHSVPDLGAFGSQFCFKDEKPVGYVKGVWASTLRYRKSNGLFYWYGAIQGTNKTYIYTAKTPEGAWTAHPPIPNFYYDAGLLIDEDDTFYIAYGTKNIQVAQLSPDGLTEVTSRVVYESEEYLEGARMYNINGTYYIWLTRPWCGQYVLKSTAGPFGPYQGRMVIGEVKAPIAGAGPPHQGSLVQTSDGRWCYMAFIDAYPAGRIPVLAPIEFDEEGWPTVAADYTTSSGQWCLEYPLIIDSPSKKHKTCNRRHLFGGGKLEPCWEWNQSPENSKWSIKDGQLLLETARVTDNLFLASNSLTHRTIGPRSAVTFCVDWSGLKDGDRAGACLFRHESAYIGVHRDNGIAKLVYVDDIKLEPIGEPVGWFNGRPQSKDWGVVSKGAIKAEVQLSNKQAWLRIEANLAPAFTGIHEDGLRQAKFEYSYDGTTVTQLGPLFVLNTSYLGFVGYRFAVFNFATIALGGRLAVSSAAIEVKQV